jgi:RNA polymerase sigma-70 factor (ECF subfamily)
VSDVAHVLPWGRDEADLVAELQSGSDEAFDWLVTHYHGPVFSLLYGMLADSADAADCTQEVFLKAFRGIRGFRRGSSLKTWLYRIGVREALNHKRWRWRHSRQQISLEAEREADAGFVEPESHTESPFDSLAAQEMREVVQHALMQVPEAYRATVILRDLEGLSYEEVSEVLDISVGTVKSRVLRGRRALREILEPVLHEMSHDHHSEPVEHRASQHVGEIGVSETSARKLAAVDSSSDSSTAKREHAVTANGISGWTPERRRMAGFSAGGAK